MYGWNNWRIRDGLERVVICLSLHFSHSLPFKGHHKWVFASKVLINKKCCLSCFSLGDLSHWDVCVIKSLNCVCLPYLVKNDCEKKLIFISLRACWRTGPTLVSVHTWPGNKGFISKSWVHYEGCVFPCLRTSDNPQPTKATSLCCHFGALPNWFG